jgi:hypothetical protein
MVHSKKTNKRKKVQRGGIIGSLTTKDIDEMLKKYYDDKFIRHLNESKKEFNNIKEIMEEYKIWKPKNDHLKALMEGLKTLPPIFKDH